MKVWVEVSEQRLVGNLRAVQQAAGEDTEVLAVVKANGYGHGAERCAVILTNAGARWLGVTCAEEGKRLRKAFAEAGIEAQPEILVMSGSLPEDADTIAGNALTPVVWTPEHVRFLSGMGSHVHIEVDTGMGRQGVLPGIELDSLLDSLANSDVRVGGIFTHFASSEVANSELTQRQQQRFSQTVSQVRARGFAPQWIHAGNSSAVDNPAQPSWWLKDLAVSIGTRAMLRTGLALYGHCLAIEGGAVPHLAPALRPVMTWKTRILGLRTLAAGDTVGYGATYTARSPMRVALLSVGYADGLRRELSSTNDSPGGWVMIGGHRANILGRISMNLTVVDVTGIEGAQVGDEVVLLGDGTSAEDHARLAGTIPYEILCGVRER